MKDIKKILAHLPDNKIQEIRIVVSRILDTGLRCKIILYGSYARGDYKDGEIIEINGERVQKRSDYDFLVVVDHQNKRVIDERIYQGFSPPKLVSDSEIDIRRSLRGIDLPVQVIVEQLSTINRRLEERHYFYTDIVSEGIEIYDSGGINLSLPSEEIDTGTRVIEAEEDFKGWIREVKSFRRQAEHAERDRDYRIESFDLEQVCEMCYKCIILVYTHYAPDEHSLYTLRDEAARYAPLIQEIFPLEPVDKAKTFDKLNLAYIGARYIRTFCVDPLEAVYWRNEADNLISFTEQTCINKIESLKNQV